MIYSAHTDILPARPPSLARHQEGSKQIYIELLEERGDKPGQIDRLAHSASRSFLLDQLGIAAVIDADFPADMRSLPNVLRCSNEQAAQDYRHYLNGRHAGSPRRYFSCRSHAMYFLRTVAPTKLVDGAWLYQIFA